MSRCAKCGAEKPLSRKDKYCKDCRRIYNHHYKYGDDIPPTVKTYRNRLTAKPVDDCSLCLYNSRKGCTRKELCVMLEKE